MPDDLRIKDRRPPRFPPPAFPTQRARLFAATPPAIFPVVLGVLGLGLALRAALAVAGLADGAFGGLAEALLGATLGLWVFAVVAFAVKILRRPSVLAEDLRPLPGRAGLAAVGISGMAAAGALLPYAPGVAAGLVWAALGVHLVMAGLVIRAMAVQGAAGWDVTPAWHLSFVGFVVAVPVLAQMGWGRAAALIFWPVLVLAVGVWAASGWQLLRRIPPAPLRPLLAIHLAPAALLATSAVLIGHKALAAGLLGLGGLILMALLVGARWVLAAGFSPLWGALTFPLAAYATALLTFGGLASLPGLLLTALALVVVPPIAWRVLRLWPGGKLARQTNAAVA